MHLQMQQHQSASGGRSSTRHSSSRAAPFWQVCRLSRRSFAADATLVRLLQRKAEHVGRPAAGDGGARPLKKFLSEPVALRQEAAPRHRASPVYVSPGGYRKVD